MSFISLKFLIFFLLVIVIYYAVLPKYRHMVLLVISYVFYACWDIKYLVFLGITTLSTYICGLYVHKKRLLLTACIILNLLAWGSFKFGLTTNSLIIPIGFSFYCLQAFGYLIDVYRGTIVAEKSIIKYALFVSFFPTIVSGPIERSNNLLKQIQNGTEFVYEKAKKGLLYMLYGCFLKVLIADRIAGAVSPIYSNYVEYEGATLLVATVFYGIQLYADFAGYSYIAVGMAKVLGFEIIENFKQPYFAKSIKEFWSRWHISLSQWLKDYIYIPLGGSRQGKIRTYCNLMATFLISGIWHGTGIKYIAWGVLHGGYQIVGKMTYGIKRNIEQKLKINTECWSYRFVKIVITFILVDFAWIFFCASSMGSALAIIFRMIGSFNLGEALLNQELFMGLDINLFYILIFEIIVLFLVDVLHEKKISIVAWLNKQNIGFRWGIYLVVALLVLLGVIYNYGMNPSVFIYSQF